LVNPAEPLKSPPVFCGRVPAVLLKVPSEVGGISDADTSADLFEGLVCVHQELFCARHLHLFGKCADAQARGCFKEVLQA